LDVLFDVLAADQLAEVVNDKNFIFLVEAFNLLDQPLFFLGKLIDNNEDYVALTQNKALQQMLG
jgi:hypothetical protein